VASELIVRRSSRSSGVQEFRSSRSSGVQEFRSSGVQEFRSSGVQEFSVGWTRKSQAQKRPVNRGLSVIG